MTESMIERVAAAISAAPELWVRKNKSRDDGLVYEVGYVEGDVITDNTIKILWAFATSDQASEFRGRHQAIMTARAAIEAMMEPTKIQLDAMEPWSRVSGHHEMVWKAGVKAALIWPAGSADIAGVPLARD